VACCRGHYTGNTECICMRRANLFPGGKRGSPKRASVSAVSQPQSTEARFGERTSLRFRADNSGIQKPRSHETDRYDRRFLLGVASAAPIADTILTQTTSRRDTTGVAFSLFSGPRMNLRNWFRPPRHALAIFVAVTVVSAAALAWLMWLLLEQDKAVELQRRQERLEQAADRAAAVMQAALGELDHASNLPGGVIAVSLQSDGVRVQPPNRLLYYPTSPRPDQVADSRFAEGEKAEFARNDLTAAADSYSRLTADPEDAVRAEALARLARVRRKSKDFAAAIRAYDQLAEISGAAVSGLPADLVAREGRASVFQETNRTADLQQEAAKLAGELRGARWQLTKSEFEFFSSEAEAWMGSTGTRPDADALAHAEAVAWLWQNRQARESVLRWLIQTDTSHALIISHATTEGITAMIGGPSYLASLCRAAVADSELQCALSDAEGRVVVGQTPPSRAAVIRTGAEAKLPWTLHVFASAPAGSAGTSPRRSLLLWVTVVLSFVWFTGAAFIVRAMAREARVAQLQSDFVAAVSHEFRSPLSSLCQISEMLAANRLGSDDMRRQAYGILTRESDRLRRLVEGLLDFQRLEAGAAVYYFEPLEITAFLKSIVAEFQERVAVDSYTIELNAPEAPAQVRADREALSRAIWNLLDNAVKYSPECRTVWVDLERDQNRVVIGVRDRGLGIPLHEQREIFEKFVRGADSKARRIKGTGIGLAMVRHIVQAHGGEILLVSQPGEGSRFSVLLPATNS
jgi:signal transduction histidine kinase